MFFFRIFLSGFWIPLMELQALWGKICAFEILVALGYNGNGWTLGEETPLLTANKWPQWIVMTCQKLVSLSRDKTTMMMRSTHMIVKQQPDHHYKEEQVHILQSIHQENELKRRSSLSLFPAPSIPVKVLVKVLHELAYITKFLPNRVFSSAWAYVQSLGLAKMP
ncbi:hypothetical protein H5410_055982 [Solanum commersonii]|uniref:Uncharacterized protein n=1 Tax=Solanum commersonii TaxID=4109 RepID=A0A9J5WLD9_SOLCO|nr:hypothetical protein H5410_055982 [Solanum commersonii]